jgi:hypothetical protein
MYRIQLTGNEYELDKEIGLHYQLHRGIGVHQTKANKKGLTKASAAFIAAISQIEENLYQVRNQSSQDPLNFPIKLNNKLASLMRVVESGDYKPTAGSYKVFEELKAELAIEINQLNKLLSQAKI